MVGMDARDGFGLGEVERGHLCWRGPGVSYSEAALRWQAMQSGFPNLRVEKSHTERVICAPHSAHRYRRSSWLSFSPARAARAL